jgi:predicted transcriptional regulator
MSDLQRYLDKQLQDPEFKKEWDKLELRYAVIKQLLKIRNAYNLSQSQLAEKLNTTQSVISRIENGTVNIGIDFIDKLAKAFDKKVEIKFS